MIWLILMIIMHHSYGQVMRPMATGQEEALHTLVDIKRELSEEEHILQQELYDAAKTRDRERLSHLS